MVRKIRTVVTRWDTGKAVEVSKDVDMDDLQASEFIWCLHCERVYRTYMFAAEHWQACANESCDGSILDWQPWLDSMPRRAHPEYPDVPIEGELYSPFR